MAERKYASERNHVTGRTMRRRKPCDGEKPCDSVTLTMKEQQRRQRKNHGTAVCRMEKEVFCNLDRQGISTLTSSIVQMAIIWYITGKDKVSGRSFLCNVGRVPAPGRTGNVHRRAD